MSFLGDANLKLASVLLEGEANQMTDKTKRYLAFALIFAAWLFSSSTRVSALCMMPPSPCEWHASHHGQSTFVGTVLAKQTVPDVLRIGEHTIPTTVEKATFRVEERFEAVSESTVDVYGFGTTNDFSFDVGSRYLVYAVREKDGKLRTSKCTRSAAIA
jgi:hypothetical protein